MGGATCPIAICFYGMFRNKQCTMYWTVIDCYILWLLTGVLKSDYNDCANCDFYKYINIYIYDTKLNGFISHQYSKHATLLFYFLFCRVHAIKYSNIIQQFLKLILPFFRILMSTYRNALCHNPEDNSSYYYQGTKISYGKHLHKVIIQKMHTSKLCFIIYYHSQTCFFRLCDHLQGVIHDYRMYK